MIACPVTAEVDRHLEAIDASERRQEQIEARADSLLADVLAPLDPENFGEAIADLDGVKRAVIASLLRAGDHAEAGRLIAQHATEFWTVIATQRATREIDNPSN